VLRFAGTGASSGITRGVCGCFSGTNSGFENAVAQFFRVFQRVRGAAIGAFMLADELKKEVYKRDPSEKAKRYCVIACHVLWRELCFYAVQLPHIYDFHFLEQGLHNTPEKLKVALQAAVDERDGEYDALLIGYGLCSSGIEGLKARTTPLVCVRAHDCITFLLGSKERYREYFDTHPGTYWYSPGWIEDSTMPGKRRWDATLATYIAMYGEESAKYLMEVTEAWIQNYGNAAYVDLEVGRLGHYREYTKACADWLDWNCDIIEGDPSLVRRFLGGEWNAEDFVVVAPGQEVIPSWNADIITVRSIESPEKAE
jgi:hypothetical protein